MEIIESEISRKGDYCTKNREDGMHGGFKGMGESRHGIVKVKYT